MISKIRIEHLIASKSTIWPPSLDDK